MGNTASLPVVSQAKFGVQLIFGDADNTARTQVTSGVYLIVGKGKRPLDTQKRYGNGFLNAADRIPVVSHASGVIHYASGEKEWSRKAMESETSSTGAVIDATTTFFTGQPSGYTAASDNAINNPENIFGLCMMPVADGHQGHSAGSFARRITTPQNTVLAAYGPTGQSVMQTQANTAKAEEFRAQSSSMYQAGERINMQVPDTKTFTEMSKVQELMNAANGWKDKLESALPKVAAQASSFSDVKVHTVLIPGEGATDKDTVGELPDWKGRSTRSKANQEDSQEDCTCTNISIPVLFANMRSVNPDNRTAPFQAKIGALRALISAYRPAIIAIVETWLGDGHQTESVADSLGLQGYTIWRQDRSGKRGGGILLGWRPTMLSNGRALRVERNPSADFGDNILSADIFVKINCMECNKEGGFHEEQQNKFGFTVVYRPPASNDVDREVRERLTDLMAEYDDYLINYDGWSVVGDFNYKAGGKDPNIQDLLQWVWDSGAQVFPDNGMETHCRGGCLDLVFASEGHVDGFMVSPESISDHHVLYYKLILGKDYRPDNPCKKCRSGRISKILPLLVPLDGIYR